MAACADCGGAHPLGLCATYAKVEGLAPRPAPEPGHIPLGEGDRLGNFWLTRKLGSGTSSEVFLGENDLTQALAAVKVLRPELHADADLVRRFESEARTTNMVRHDHVVEIHDIGVHSGWQHYITLEYLDGPTLGQLLQKRMDVPTAGAITLQLCAALGAAHQKGVVHRDLKPANVFVLQRNGRPHAKLVDFGMARRERLDEGESRTRFGTIVGTALYMAPEQALGGEIDGRSDVYSLGVVLFQMVTGQLPFVSDNPMMVIIAHQNEAPPRPSALDPAVSPALEAVILKCLAKKPYDRFANVEDLGRAVAAAIRGEELGVPLGGPLASGPRLSAQFVAAAPQPAAPPGPEPARAGPKTTPVGVPAVRREPRVPTSFGVQLHVGGQQVGDAQVADVSLGGAFVQTALALPLFCRVRVVGATSQGPVDAAGEVVRLSQDKDRPGFGMRFDVLKEPQRKVLEALVRARAGDQDAKGDPQAEAQLKQFEARQGNDFYALLGVPRDASTRQVRDVCERLVEEMSLRRFGALTAGQQARINALRQRLGEAEEVLVDPRQRALYDAVNGNVLGVLRVITEGLPLEALDQVRGDFLKVRPDAEARAAPAREKAEAAARSGDFGLAMRLLADALCDDPLNLALHRRAVELRGNQVRPPAPGAERPGPPVPG